MAEAKTKPKVVRYRVKLGAKFFDGVRCYYEGAVIDWAGPPSKALQPVTEKADKPKQRPATVEVELRAQPVESE